MVEKVAYDEATEQRTQYSYDGPQVIVEYDLVDGEVSSRRPFVY